MSASVVPVVVVGAGPSGVTAATLLAQYGVEVLVLDRWAEVYPQPRAVHLDDEIYRILARLGVADEFARISRPTQGFGCRTRSTGSSPSSVATRAPAGTATRRRTCSTSPTSRHCCVRT